MLSECIRSHRRAPAAIGGSAMPAGYPTGRRTAQPGGREATVIGALSCEACLFIAHCDERPVPRGWRNRPFFRYDGL